MKSLREIFPKASKSFFEANPATLTHPDDKNEKLPVQASRKRGFKNNTEREFSFILEAQKRHGEILRYDYEGITLRWPVEYENKTVIIKYTPDFVVFPPAIAVSGQIKLIEVKGRFIKGHFAQAVERFQHARTYWPEFIFELHQKTADGWRRMM